jgi:Cyanobacterial and plant NDH-1 subunit O
MADSSAPSAARDTAGSSAAVAPAALKKGSLVRLNLEAYRGSLEAGASDAEVPGYVLEGPGEILVVRGDVAQIRWRRPVPDVWLRLDQLLPWQA